MRVYSFVSRERSLFLVEKIKDAIDHEQSFSFRSERAPFVLISNTTDAIDRANFSFHFERALRSS